MDEIEHDEKTEYDEKTVENDDSKIHWKYYLVYKHFDGQKFYFKGNYYLGYLDWVTNKEWALRITREDADFIAEKTGAKVEPIFKE